MVIRYGINELRHLFWKGRERELLDSWHDNDLSADDLAFWDPATAELVDGNGSNRGTYVQAGGQEHVDLCAAPIAVSNFGGAVVQGSYFKGQIVVGGDVVDQYAEWDVYLKAGTYTLDLFHYTAANNGIYTVALDGATIATVDGYAASAAATRTQQTSIAVASSGVKRLRVTVASKNASSTGYRSRLSWATLTKTA